MVKFSRPLQICCAVTLLLLIIITVTAVTLYFTVFKPKQPKITTQSVTLDSFSINLFDPKDTNVTLGIMVTVDNPNYGGFKYGNSTTYVTYHGNVVAMAPITEDTIPARGRHDVSTTVMVVGKSLMTNPYFAGDKEIDTYNFTSNSMLQGKAIVMKLFKMKATSYCTCDISVHFVAQNSTSVCTSRVKF